MGTAHAYVLGRFGSNATEPLGVERRAMSGMLQNRPSDFVSMSMRLDFGG
jgi:hypothetical protein